MSAYPPTWLRYWRAADRSAVQSVPVSKLEALLEKLTAETRKARADAEFGRAGGLEDAADEVEQLILEAKP